MANNDEKSIRPMADSKKNIDRTSVKLMSHLRKIEQWQSSQSGKSDKN